ncbi:MAG: SsrA-binding protein SmpB [Bdellovibrionales bacterium]|nr:SsrA-binding protein SmpB [Bdellovibrionales bacterium]
MAKPEASPHKVIATNREARHRFFIHETVEAGIVLTGTEVKSLRGGKAVMGDSYAFIKNGECWLGHLHIPEYSHGNRENHEPMRERKLLLHKREIEKLESSTAKKGMTIVPLQLYFSKGRVKVELGLAKGKNVADKRQAMKDRSVKKELAQMTKRNRKG